MIIRQPNRVRNKPSRYRRWFHQAMSHANSQPAPRRLNCEPLERRYALHGVSWFDGADCDVTHVTTIVTEDGTTYRLAHVRSLGTNGQWARPEPKITDSPNASDVQDPSTDIDADGEDDSLASCDRPQPKGLMGEGEPPTFDPLDGRGGSRPGPTGHAGIELEPSHAPPRASSPATQTEASHPAANSTSGSSVNATPVDGGKSLGTAERGPAKNSSAQSFAASTSNGLSSIGLPGLTITLGSVNSLSVGNALGASAGSGASTPVASQTRSSVSASPSASPATTSLGNESITTSQHAANALRSSTASSASHSISASSEHSATAIRSSHSHATLGDSWVRANSTEASESSALAGRDTERLLERLQSVIDSLASDRPVDKADASHERTAHSKRHGFSDQLPIIADEASTHTDGMLELTAVGKLEATVGKEGSAVSKEAAYRSQLLAALELSREFELAGQAVQSLQKVLDPTARVTAARSTADEVANWGHADSTSATSSPGGDASQTPLWQRTLWPLGFLAIGGLLIRRRRTEPFGIDAP